MTEINEVNGPTVVDGNQHNHYAPFIQIIADVNKRIPRLIPADDLTWHDQRFVAPPNLGAAREQLHDHRIRAVFLTGPPGSGLTTAAKMLLHELRDESGPFTPLPEEDQLNPNDVPWQGRLLLDLSHADAATVAARSKELPSLRAVLPDQQAYLVVVLGENVDPHANPDLLRYTVGIEKPRGDLVLLRHLKADGIYLSDDELAQFTSKAQLDGPVLDIANLASLVRRAAQANPQGSTADWLNDALAATNRTAEVAELVHNHSSIRDRAVLLAAAMCPGAKRDAVFFAAQQLLDVVGSPTEGRVRLEQQGYLQQLKNLQIQHNDLSVWFPSFQYDHAVRVHFWDNYPDLRTAFCTWTDNLLTLSGLTVAEREELLDRFLEQALRTGCSDEVATLVDKWAKSENNKALWMRFATRALTTGLRNDSHGGRFRKLVYDWSTDSALPAHLGPLLVDVCTDVIAPVYPEQAVVRLHHRARREGTHTPTPTARATLRELTNTDPILFRFLLHRVVNGIEKQQSPVDYTLFLDLANSPRLTDPHNRAQPLVADKTVRAQLVRGWRATLRQDRDTVARAVSQLLSTAANTHKPEVLLSILVDAAGRNVALLGTLHRLARTWQLRNPRVNLVQPINGLIDAAQGINPRLALPGYGAHTMNKQNTILMIGLAIAFALPLIVGLVLHWPFWITGPLLAAVLAGIYRLLVHPTYTVIDHVKALLETAGLSRDNPTRDLTARRLAELFEASGNPTLAITIRREFDTPLG